jgi:hypothetical protein
MTLEEVRKQIEATEAELRRLRELEWTLMGNVVIPGFGRVGVFADDLTFEEAMRLGREERERVNRESLEEFDREEAVAAKAREASK